MVIIASTAYMAVFQNIYFMDKKHICNIHLWINLFFIDI